ncbi:MAG: 3-dehydroquinate synthase [Alphaproteobacteria bacterium]
MSETLHVALGGRSYDIAVGEGLLARAGELTAKLLPGKRAIIVTDPVVGDLYAEKLKAALAGQGWQVDEQWVKAGEASKSFASYEMLMEQLLALAPDRRTAIFALGGGVIGDLAGFAASTLLRGVPLVQVPTTLLAQVDSSIGGKTGINSRAGKNLIGSFYQPKLVIADLDVLKSLKPRELRAGYAEIIKYGLILDAEFYRWCLAHGAKLVAGDAAALKTAVVKSCAMKADIVERDEREGDARAWLNFGHTFGHALEAETGYGAVLHHGEAVALGMVMGCRLSAELKLLDASVVDELASHLKSLGLPVKLSDVDFRWNTDGICSHFAQDKKAEGGALAFVVLDAIGKARVLKNVDPALARRVVELLS